MTFSSKVVTDGTPPSSSGGKAGGRVPLSEPSASLESTQPNTPTTPVLSKPTSKDAPKDRTTLNALFLKAAFSYLKRAGLARSFKVLSADKTTVQDIVIVLSAKYWTENLDLKVLSE